VLSQKIGSQIDASLSRQPHVKSERLVRLETNAAMDVIETSLAQVSSIIHILLVEDWRAGTAALRLVAPRLQKRSSATVLPIVVVRAARSRPSSQSDATPRDVHGVSTAPREQQKHCVYHKFKRGSSSRPTSEASAADALTYRHSFARLTASCSRGKFGGHTHALLLQQRLGAAPFPSECNK
jgi:hypothetical protein